MTGALGWRAGGAAATSGADADTTGIASTGIEPGLAAATATAGPATIMASTAVAEVAIVVIREDIVSLSGLMHFRYKSVALFY
ncbi:hypothetical protein [Nocardia rhizosphaerae]|uniref:Uncharacterized protein n=1 Tax=Nocardia rhizosphaerae TaxID=1691571 RepID=A0ABV8LAB7_9NOCA